MKRNSQWTGLTATASLAATVLTLAGHTVADPVAFDQTPLSNIVAQLNQQYGVNIVLKGSLAQNAERAVTLHVGDTGTTPTRLQVINALANAAGVDFQKGFVVSKIASEDAPPPIKIDSNGYVVFKDTTVSAREAIAEVATTDNATIQVSPDVTGSVTFSKMTLRTADAAAEIARQTHTRWRVYYALTPHNMARRGKVVDRNDSGQAIVELPFTYYGSKTVPGTNATDNAATNPATAGTPGDTTLPPSTGTTPVGGGVNLPPYSYVPPLAYGGQMPYTTGNYYGADAFGNPYQSQYGYFGYGGGYPNGGYPGAGYPSGGGFSNGGVTILPGQGGYGPFGGYGAPVTF